MTSTSLFAIATGRPASRASSVGVRPGGAGGAHEEDIDVGRDRHLVHSGATGASGLERVIERGRHGFGAGVTGVEFGDLACELIAVSPGSERNDFEAPGKLANHVERLPADRPRRTENSDASGPIGSHNAMLPGRGQGRQKAAFRGGAESDHTGACSSSPMATTWRGPASMHCEGQWAPRRLSRRRVPPCWG